MQKIRFRTHGRHGRPARTSEFDDSNLFYTVVTHMKFSSLTLRVPSLTPLCSPLMKHKTDLLIHYDRTVDLLAQPRFIASRTANVWLIEISDTCV